MHQGRGLECLTGAFLGQSLRRESPQLVVDEREQLTRGVWIAGLSRLDNSSDVARHLVP